MPETSVSFLVRIKINFAIPKVLANAGHVGITLTAAGVASNTGT